MKSGTESGNCRVRRFGLNARGRDLAVGDIHGHFNRLDAALTAIGFSPGRDRLFAVGDLVDRGPESADVLAWLERPWFHAICGNHDLITWRRALNDPIPDVDHLAHGGRWLDACDGPTRARIAACLRALPLAIVVETANGVVGLVHADFPYDDWQAIHGAAFSPEDEDACLWSIDRYRMQYARPIRNVRAVVHGHMTLREPTQLGNVYYIDTGGWQDGGRFTLLDLHTLKPGR